MPELILTDIDPRRLVSSNRRIHHMVRAKVCSYWREKAEETVRAEYGHADDTWHQRVRLVLTFRFPTAHRRDVGNFYPYVAKPIVDGLVDARLIPDDDDKHLIGPDLRRDPERGEPRIVIRIEDIA